MVTLTRWCTSRTTVLPGDSVYQNQSHSIMFTSNNQPGAQTSALDTRFFALGSPTANGTQHAEIP